MARDTLRLMKSGLTDAQLLKFELLGSGLVLGTAALEALADLNGGRSLTPHDYASTSGVILRLEDDVWVNAPIQRYNPNFVTKTPYLLGYDAGFYVEGGRLASRATFWPQPEYHASNRAFGELNSLVVTHGDRARLSPIRSCAMTCSFCDIPYEFPMADSYKLKDVDHLLEAVRVALHDPLQPAHHLLVSGGTPKPKDVPWMRDFYSIVLAELSDTPVDIMMVPLPGLLDLPRLVDLGIQALSINIELYGRDRAKQYARHKYNQGLRCYLDFIEQAANYLGHGRARSMLMVGLEPLEDTLAGVQAIAERGGTPVLSPFRPDPSTPLSGFKPPTSEFMLECYTRASEIAARFGANLGPDCPPCTHNTMNFATITDSDIVYPHERPAMLGEMP